MKLAPYLIKEAYDYFSDVDMEREEPDPELSDAGPCFLETAECPDPVQVVS